MDVLNFIMHSMAACMWDTPVICLHTHTHRVIPKIKDNCELWMNPNELNSQDELEDF